MSDEHDLLARALRSAERDAPPLGAKERALAAVERDRLEMERLRRRSLARPVAVASVLAFAAGAIFAVIARRPTSTPRPDIVAVSDAESRGLALAASSGPAVAASESPSTRAIGAAATPPPNSLTPPTPATSESIRAHRSCASSALPESPPRSCAVPGEPLLLDVQNDCDEPLELFWVNAECREVSYGTLAPGARRFQGTVATHPWRLRSKKSGAIVREIEPTGTPVAQPKPRSIAITATDADPAPTDAPPTLCSEAGHAIDWTLTNGRSKAVELSFIGYDCKEEPRRLLAPGESFHKVESDGHRWRLRDAATKKLVREVFVEGVGAGRRRTIVVP